MGSEHMDGIQIAVLPTPELQRRRRMFDAVADLYDVRFVEAGAAAVVAGVITFGDVDESGPLGAYRDAPRLIFPRQDEAVVTVAEKVDFEDTPSLVRWFRGFSFSDSSLGPVAPLTARPGDEVLARAGGSPMWIRRSSSSASWDLIAALPPDIGEGYLYQSLEGASRMREIRETAKRNADREARKIVALAVQRIAAEHTAEITASAVSLPKDDMKGRIIGREGRNIRAFELATGVDVIIDDTPDTVVVSCFDPVRREVARLALEKLVADGRIHPGRIEEVVEKARKEVDAGIVETGERAAYDVNVHGLHPELIKLIGRMKWRTSYGQNILDHSKEVAWLAGIMADELGLDAAMARRGALLHDVGKVLTHEHEGTHVQLGVEVATKYGENPLVVNCIAAHHDDVPHESEVSVLVQAADAISGSRPGARREAFETYVKRLEGLERIASSYRGVDRVFAIQAGREIRVLVNPDDVDDARMQSLTEEIARRVEAEMQYPGQIKVVAIREKRAMDIAR